MATSSRRSRTRPRGRPRKPGGAKSAAERMRAYRKRLKAAGVSARQRKPADGGSNVAERRRLADALSRLAALKARLEELRAEYDRMYAERQRASSWINVTIKEIIVVKNELAAAQKSTKAAKKSQRR